MLSRPDTKGQILHDVTYVRDLRELKSQKQKQHGGSRGEREA